MHSSKRVGPIDARGWLTLASVAIFAFAYGGFLIGTAAGGGEDPVFTPTAVAAGAIGGLVLAILFDALILWTWRRAGGQAESRRRMLAIRSGVLPSDVDAVRWLPAFVARERSMSPILLWLWPALAVLYIAIAISDFARHPGRFSETDVLVPLFIAYAAYGIFYARRRMPNLRRLISELERRQESGQNAG